MTFTSGPAGARLSSARARVGARNDAGVSEIVGTLLMTTAAVVVLGGFGVLVLQSVSSAGEPPIGSFALAATPGARFVDVTFLSGSSFALSDATFGVTVNDSSSAASDFLVKTAGAGVFSPGGVLRVNLSASAPNLGAGTKLLFLAADAATGKSIGITTLTLATAGAETPLASNGLAITSVSVSPAIIPADGAHVTNLSVHVVSTLGTSLVGSVTVNLSGLGGPGAAVLADDGLNGDALADDGIYTLRFAAGVHDFPTGVATLTIPFTVTASDEYRHSASATGTVRIYNPANSTTTTKFILGNALRNLPASSAIGQMWVTNFTWRDPSALDDNVLLFHVTDLSDFTKTWDLEIDYTSANCGGNRAGIESVVFSRDGVAGAALWKPTNATDCFLLGPTSTLQLLNLNASVNAWGKMEAWQVQLVCPCVAGATPATYDYRHALISGSNIGVISFVGIVEETSNPHTNPPGVGGADLHWSLAGPPSAAFTSSPAGFTASVDGGASSDPQGFALSYAWDWGDGSALGSGVKAQHTYSSAGTRTVTLTVTDTLGAAASASAPVTTDGKTWFGCPPATIVSGTLALCANLASDTDAQASATLTETGAASKQQADMRFIATGAPEVGRTHTLSITLKDTTNPETLLVQVLATGSCASSTTWTTLISVPLTTVSFTTFTAPLTAAQWASGAACIRLVDSIQTGDALTSAWAIDALKVVTS
ncbi:MAG: PKD domain-containing protein [Thermoplasmatota archaeon]